MRGRRNGQGIQSAAFKSITISNRPNRSIRANLLDLVERASGTQVKIFKNRVVTKKGSARPIDNAFVDILKLLEVNSTFARPKPTSLDRVERPSGWSYSASISNASFFYARASLARPSFGRVGLEWSTLAPFGLVSLAWVLKALITLAFGVK